MNKNLLCRGLSCCITSSLVWALQRQAREALGPHRGIHTPHLTPQDFTHPNGEMNSPTDYMSNTFYSSSLSDAQVECSLNAQALTRSLSHTRTKLSHNHQHSGSELPYPLWDYATCQSEWWLSLAVDTHTLGLDCPGTIKINYHSSPCASSVCRQLIGLDSGGHGFGKAMCSPAHWSWNCVIIPSGHHASLLTWTQRKATPAGGEVRGEENKNKMNARTMPHQGTTCGFSV